MSAAAFLRVSELVSGPVPQIHCPWCKVPRFDDGRACAECGEYAKPRFPGRVVFRGVLIRAPRCWACDHADARQFLFARPICGSKECRERVRLMCGPKRGKVS